MSRVIGAALVAALALSAAALGSEAGFEAAPVERLAFGSCYEPFVDDFLVRSGERSIWEGIGAFDPDVLLLLGDSVYTDRAPSEAWPGYQSWKTPADPGLFDSTFAVFCAES
jgi:hypothetical protein